MFVDLADARDRDGGTVHFGTSGTEVLDVESDRPRMRWTGPDGTRHEVRARYVVGADGSRSQCRAGAADHRTQHAREYPFAWFGIMAEAPKSATELVYAHSEHGFALISQRTESVQRMYFQCDPDDDPAAWSDDRIWTTMQARVAGEDGFQLLEDQCSSGPCCGSGRSCREPMRWGSLLLAGDAAHTVPDRRARAQPRPARRHRARRCWSRRSAAPTPRSTTSAALRRVWRAQNFSYWMTQLLHAAPGGSSFDLRRQLGELDNVVSTRAGRTYLAEQYTGWPTRDTD